MTEQRAAGQSSVIEFSLAFIAVGRWAFVGLLLALGVQILRFSLGDFLSVTDPALSMAIDPTQTAARNAMAQRILADDLSKIDDAVAGARAALRDDPLSHDALDLLARTSELNGDEGTAAQLMILASRVDLRDLSSQLQLLNRDLRDARAGPALQRIDAILRGQYPQVIEALAPSLPKILAREPYSFGYVKLLRQNPPWRSVWFVDLLRRSNELSDLNYLFAELQGGENGPTEKELQVFLTRMTEAGLLDEGYDAWLRSLPPERRDELPPLYNANFRYPLTNLPFDWVIRPVPHAVVQVGSQGATPILNVAFLGGRVNFEHISHLLNLAPGAYRFQGRERSQSLQNERGLRWRISCVGAGTATLGASAPLNGETPWRDFSFDFVVLKEQCSYQTLVLELPARTALESEISGEVSYANMDIREADRNSMPMKP
jgi:hypothetical protein